MPFDAHVLKVLIASPSDTKEARDEVEKSLHSWNTSRAEREGIILLPRRWETAAIPRMGQGDGQEVINADLVEDADIIVVVFNSKLGQATARALSGTVEELEKGVRDGKQVHVYFSEAPVTRDNLKSAAEVENFRKTLEDKGLYGSYSDAADLGFKVRNAVESDLEKLNLAAPTGRRTASGADPVARHTFSREQQINARGKIQYRNRNHKIVVENHGDAPAENFTFELVTLGDLGGDAPDMFHEGVAPTIPARGNFGWSIDIDFGTSLNLQMDMKWEEDGKEKTKTQSLSLL